MKVTEITESVIDGGKININNYNKMMKIMKSKIMAGDLNNIKIKNRILHMWNSGERLVSKYDMKLIDLGVSIKKMLK